MVVDSEDPGGDAAGDGHFGEPEVHRGHGIHGFHAHQGSAHQQRAENFPGREVRGVFVMQSVFYSGSFFFFSGDRRLSFVFVFYCLPGAFPSPFCKPVSNFEPKTFTELKDSLWGENPLDKTLDDGCREAMVISVTQVTQLLDAIESGDPAAAGHLLPLVYEELRKLAAAKMAHEKPGQTLQPTALVHEAWLRLAGSEQRWNGRHHFFGAAAEAMRRILVDRARKKSAQRHGGQWQRVDLEHVTLATEDSDETVLAIHEALEKLDKESPQKAEIVKLHYFADMKYPEIAQSLGISLATVERHWAYARSWLYRELKQNLSNR